MIEMMITSSVLIAVVLLIRRLVGRNIDMRLRYALWLLVALRLVLPVNVGNSGVSVLNLLPQTWQSYNYNTEEFPADETADAESEYAEVGMNGTFLIGLESLGEKKGSLADPEAALVANMEAALIPDTTTDDLTGETEYSGKENADILLQEPVLAGEKESVTENGTVNPAENDPAGRNPVWSLLNAYHSELIVTWVAGILLVGGYMALAQLRFVRYLRRNREAVPMQRIPGEWAARLAEHNMKVSQVKGLPSPCLVGRNIYISPKMCRETDRLPHILAHEYCHARQHDTLWAFLRSVLTAVYWFHPLVWVAAYGAKQDSELACDAAAIRLLGEADRYEYGRTLLYLLKGGSNKVGYAGMVLTMDGKESGIRERVSMIAKSHGRKKWAAAVVGVIMCVSCGCAFTGAKDAGQTEESRAAKEAGAEIQTEDFSPQEKEIKLLAEENAILEKENEQPVEALEESQKQFSEREKQAESEMSVWEQSQTELKAKLSAEEQRLEALRKEASEGEAFQKLLYLTEADVILQNKEIDLQAYGEYYLGDTEECPLEDGTWYLLKKDASGIVLYGLYTEEYGCYGIGILIDGDMNFFMEEWLPGYMPSSVEVLEWTEDGLPGTFAFKMGQTNTGNSEIWKLYVADRYDTGHVELYTFPAAKYQKQFEDMMEFSIQQDSGQIMVICEGDMVVGEMDVSAFEDYVIEDVVWEGDPLAFQLNDDFPVGVIDAQSEVPVKKENPEEPIMMVTSIGLKLRGIDEVWYYGLPMLVFPIDTGEWGEHEMTLGTPSVGHPNYVTKPQTALPDVEEKMGKTPIHLTEPED